MANIIRNGVVTLAALVSALASAVMPSEVYAQSALARDYGPCVVNGQRYNNCVDEIYQTAQNADEIYHGSKRVSRGTTFTTRYRFLNASPSEWDRYFFGEEEKAKKLQDILRQDPQINFESFSKLNRTYRGKIEKMLFLREGFLVMGIIDQIIGAYIIPISPETVDKIRAL